MLLILYKNRRFRNLLHSIPQGAFSSSSCAGQNIKSVLDSRLQDLLALWMVAENQPEVFPRRYSAVQKKYLQNFCGGGLDWMLLP